MLGALGYSRRLDEAGGEGHCERSVGVMVLDRDNAGARTVFQ